MDMLNFRLNARYFALFLVTVLLAGLSACDLQEPVFETYTPPQPNFLFPEVENQMVRIVWENAPVLQNGYLLEKSIDNGQSFTEIARLPFDADRYLDESGEYPFPTRYRVTAFHDPDADITATDDSPDIVINNTYQRPSLSVRGNDIRVIYFRFMEIADQIVLERSIDGGTFEVVETLDGVFDLESPAETYLDRGQAVSGRSLSYRYKYVNSTGESDYTPVSSITVP